MTRQDVDDIVSEDAAQAPAPPIRRRKTPALEGLAYANRPDVLLHNIARLQRSRFGRLAREIGLTGAQGQVLNRLSIDKGISLSTLAEMLEVELITASRLVDDLEKRGWVERRPSPTDRRIKLIFMLEAATDVQVKMHAIANQLRDSLFSEVTPEEYAVFEAILTKIHESISRKP